MAITDPEVAAMLVCVQAVADLNPEQQARIAHYLYQRYEIQPLQDQVNKTIDKLESLVHVKD